MIGDKARECLSDHTSRFKLNRRMMCSLTSKTPQIGDNPLNNRDFIFTDGLYSIEYSPSNGPSVPKGAVYLIKCDIFFRKATRVFRYSDMQKKAKEDPKMDFLLRWTTFSPEHFEMARANIGMKIPFVFDAIKYYNNIKEENPEVGLDVFTEPGMSYYEQKRREIEKEIAWAGQIAKIEV
jgi:hypothetical protein